MRLLRASGELVEVGGRSGTHAVFAHGLCDGVGGVRPLANELRLIGVSSTLYNRHLGWIDDPPMQPKEVFASGALQQDAIGFLSVAATVFANPIPDTQPLFISHSIGGPVVTEANHMVQTGELPESLQTKNEELSEIFGRARFYQIDPAGLMDNYALWPGGNSAWDLVKAVGNGMNQITADKFHQGFLATVKALSQLGRITEQVAGHPSYTIAQCSDVCNDRPLQNLAEIPPKKTLIIAHEGDEIFPARKLVHSLKHPDITSIDPFIYQALRDLRPDIAKLSPDIREFALQAAVLITKAAVKIRREALQSSASINGFSPSQLRKLAEHADRLVALEGNHTSVNTSRGARSVAGVIARDLEKGRSNKLTQ